MLLTHVLRQLERGPDGSLVIIGGFHGTVDFDPGSGEAWHTSNGFGDVFVLKLDSNESFVWVRTFGGENGEVPMGGDVGADGSIVVTGWFYGMADFDPTDGIDEHTSNGFADAFITKLHADGSYAWTRTVGAGEDTTGLASAINSDGDVLYSGYFETNVDFDPSEAGTDWHQSEGNADAFVTKLTADGSYLWTRTFGGDDFEGAYGLALGKNDTIALVGIFESELLTFD